jgi:hypothetical protein
MNIAVPPVLIPFRLHCYLCGDTGKLLAIKRGENTLPFAFRCTCSRGHAIRASFPRWTVFSEKSFEILTTVQAYGTGEQV